MKEQYERVVPELRQAREERNSWQAKYGAKEHTCSALQARHDSFTATMEQRIQETRTQIEQEFAAKSRDYMTPSTCVDPEFAPRAPNVAHHESAMDRALDFWFTPYLDHGWEKSPLMVITERVTDPVFLDYVRRWRNTAPEADVFILITRGWHFDCSDQERHVFELLRHRVEVRIMPPRLYADRAPAKRWASMINADGVMYAAWPFDYSGRRMQGRWTTFRHHAENKQYEKVDIAGTAHEKFIAHERDLFHVMWNKAAVPEVAAFEFRPPDAPSLLLDGRRRAEQNRLPQCQKRSPCWGLAPRKC